VSDFNEYQRRTAETAIYPADLAIEYLALGLVSEAGEVAGKVKKWIRDDALDLIAFRAALADVLWELGHSGRAVLFAEDINRLAVEIEAGRHGDQ
jgi:NTP pyrophosphatase (non-canonical NTP hydrolase)